LDINQVRCLGDRLLGISIPSFDKKMTYKVDCKNEQYWASLSEQESKQLVLDLVAGIAVPSEPCRPPDDRWFIDENNYQLEDDSVTAIKLK
jgi:hypothetical protein